MKTLTASILILALTGLAFAALPVRLAPGPIVVSVTSSTHPGIPPGDYHGNVEEDGSVTGLWEGSDEPVAHSTSHGTAYSYFFIPGGPPNIGARVLFWTEGGDNFVRIQRWNYETQSWDDCGNEPGNSAGSWSRP